MGSDVGCLQRLWGRHAGVLCLMSGVLISVLAPGNAPGYGEVTIAGGSPKTMGLNYRYSLATNPLTGYPAIASIKTTRQGVQLATFNGTTWVYESVVDGTETVTGISLAFDPVGGEPRIAYFQGTIRVAIRSGSTWTVETVSAATSLWTGTGRSMYLLIPPSGSPVTIVYVAGGSTPYVRYAERVGANSYSVQTIEGSGAPLIVGEYLSAAVNPGTGGIGAVYSYRSDLVPGNSIHYAYKPAGGSFSTETAISAGGNSYLAFGDRGAGTEPLIARASSPAQVYHKNGATWDPETVGTFSAYDFQRDPSTGRAVVLAVSSSTLYVIRHTGSAWVSEAVGTSQSTFHMAQALTLSPTGVVTATEYRNIDESYSNGSLTAFRNPTGPFSSELVIDLRSPGYYPSVLVGSTPGDVWVSYQESMRDRLCLSHLEGGEFIEEVIDSSQYAGSYTNLIWPVGSAKPWIVYGRSAGPAAAVFNGTSYSIEAIAASGTRTVAAIDPVTSEVCAAMNTDSALYFARRTGSNSWNVETVPVGLPNIGGDLAMGFDPAGRPRLLFTRTTSGDPRPLYEATYNGAAWSVQPIAATGSGNYASKPSMARDPVSGELMALYVLSGSSAYELRLRRHNGVEWSADETVTNLSGSSGQTFPRLIPDPVSGDPIVCYGRLTTPKNLFRLARKSGGVWSSTTLSDELTLPFNGTHLAGAISPSGLACFVAVDTSKQRLAGWIDYGLLYVGAGGTWNRYE